jgi:hypothetical protein
MVPTGAAAIDLALADYLQQRDRVDGAPPPLDVRDIVALLRKSTVAEVRDGAREPFRRLQALVINDDVAGLMATLARWLQGKGNSDADAPMPSVTPQLLRFAAHAVLFFNAGGLANATESADCCAVLRAYIEHLMRERDTPLVAQYVALLPDENERVERFVQYMEHITEPTARQRCLVEAEKAGLDVAAVTRNVVERARTAPPPTTSTPPPPPRILVDRAHLHRRQRWHRLRRIAVIVGGRGRAAWRQRDRRGACARARLALL